MHCATLLWPRRASVQHAVALFGSRHACPCGQAEYPNCYGHRHTCHGANNDGPREKLLEATEPTAASGRGCPRCWYAARSSGETAPQCSRNSFESTARSLCFFVSTVSRWGMPGSASRAALHISATTVLALLLLLFRSSFKYCRRPGRSFASRPMATKKYSGLGWLLYGRSGVLIGYWFFDILRLSILWNISGPSATSKAASLMTEVTPNEPRKRHREDIRGVDTHGPRQWSLEMHLEGDIRRAEKTRSSTGVTQNGPRQSQAHTWRTPGAHSPRPTGDNYVWYLPMV